MCGSVAQANHTNVQGASPQDGTISIIGSYATVADIRGARVPETVRQTSRCARNAKAGNGTK